MQDLGNIVFFTLSRYNQRSMRRIPIIFIIIFNLNLNWVSLAFSQAPTESFRTEVKATVGEFFLNISGYISPFASLALTTPQGIYLRSAVADSGGNFAFLGIPIKRGFSGFCITAVDFKRLGESVTCFTFAPATESITMIDIFLPPTLGLLRNVISEGSDAIAFGYSMPGALVTLSLSNGVKVSTTADDKGYYEFRMQNLKAGRYELFATAQYKGKNSLSPTKKLLLKSVSAREEITGNLLDLLKKSRDLFTSILRTPLWLAIPLIILIIILLRKLFPDKFTSIQKRLPSKVFPWELRKKRKLHHFWFVGY